MRARIRTAAVLAAVTAAVVLAVAGCGGDDEPTASPPTTETTHQGHTTTATTTTPTPKPKPTPSSRTFTIVVRQGRPQGGIKTYTVKKGEKVALVVRSDAGESVHLHGYWIEQPVVAGSPTRIALTAKTPGRFELELHAPDAVLATLQVEP